MKAFITQFSHQPIKQDITSAADVQHVERQIGYRIIFHLQTQSFHLEGSCELMQYPLTDKEMEEKLLSALKTDLQDLSIVGITGILE